MAGATGEIRGSWGLIDQLLVPRPITHVVLVGGGLACAAVAWHFLDVKLLAYLGGVLAPFCLLCAGAVWGMRDKLDEALTGENMDAETFRRSVAKATRERQRFMKRSALVAVASLLAGSPAVAHQTAGAVWHWMVLGAGAAVGEATYSYLLANQWGEEIRAFRAKRLLASKVNDERGRLEERLRAAPTIRVPDDDWQVGAPWPGH